MTVQLHCGWPKTGTTSLQAALAARREHLAAAGFAYPDRWHRGDDSHNGLADLWMEARLRGDEAYSDLGSFLDARREQCVIFSCEHLTVWLLNERRYRSLSSFLDAVQTVAPVRCTWTLRRLDEVLVSQFLQLTRSAAYDVERLRTMMRSVPVTELFTRMQALEHAAGAAEYVKYEPDGAHAGTLLRSFGLPAEEVAAVQRQIRVSPRLNLHAGRKQVAAMRDVEQLAVRSGAPLDRQRLMKAFTQGFRFDRDLPWDPAEPTLRAELHERSLEAAQQAEFEPYLRFFAAASIRGGGGTEPPSQQRDLDDEDVAHLVAFVLGDQRK